MTKMLDPSGSAMHYPTRPDHCACWSCRTRREKELRDEIEDRERDNHANGQDL